ncbi:four-carbon acid sugar kinase family protein [Xylanibacter caecicola]|uniref:four-carbon acid sugar kinase family protein n=1 Tax=Xylanibacter caecicola TaxID=2736294 RepID=UPI002584080F|nr:four-carbon acid sugar kinase family protein [Xylanibacter caecicola]
MIIVIADDVTGAAEMAGVALRNGLDVQFITEISCDLPDTDVLVVATDTRSFSRQEAVDTVRHIADYLNEKRNISVFKKTDSVLRGHVMAELETLATSLGYCSTILLPQNPSKGRIISNGRYYIDGTPLHETSFSYDPEFPATTSCVEDIAKGSISMPLNEVPQQNRVNIGDASDLEELRIQVGKIGKNCLVAGGADTFNLFLNRPDIKKKSCTDPVINTINSGKTLVICGSTQSKSLIAMPYFKRCSSAEEGMPLDVFHGSPADKWLDTLYRSYTEHQALIIKIGHEATGGKEYAVRLRNLMSTVTASLINIEKPGLLVIEGGATAFAALKALQWNIFNVKKELSPGVVCLTYGDTDIILKPGSYPWGCMFE